MDVFGLTGDVAEIQSTSRKAVTPHVVKNSPNRITQYETSYVGPIRTARDKVTKRKRQHDTPGLGKMERSEVERKWKRRP